MATRLHTSMDPDTPEGVIAQTSPIREGGAARRWALVAERALACAICPYHRRENRKRGPRPDKYKSHRRHAHGRA